MRKRDIFNAAEQGWSVKDDTGNVGKVVGYTFGETHLLVKWKDGEEPKRVHHSRVESA